MDRHIPLLGIALVSFLLLVLSIAYASTGVVRDDPERNISIPDELLMDLEVKVAYNATHVFWRFEWDAPQAGYMHDYLVYEAGEWIRHGASPVGSEPLGLYEDRLTFFLDDGSVEFFREYGGFITVVSDMRFMTRDVSQEEAQEHIGRDDVRKFLPETRDDPRDWRTLKSPAEIAALAEAGYFLDLWHWRAHRSNPIGYADDESVSWYRLGDEGSAPFTTNLDAATEQPRWMYNASMTGMNALEWQRILARDYGFDDPYWLSMETAVAFDPARDWQDGDVLPNRILRVPEGSRGSIFANGIWDDGKWFLDLTRALDTGNPLDDKALEHLGMYSVAFAVHRDATGSRWHYVSFPFDLGMERATADIVAQRFEGTSPPWDAIPWTMITLFYPGQVSWDHVYSPSHAGYEAMQQKMHVRAAHSEEELAHYAVESEFREEIQAQWRQTFIAASLYFVLVSGAVVLYTRPRRGGDTA